MKRTGAVAVLLETPAGIPLVSDPHKPQPWLWKLPGGRCQPGEEPAAAAARELREEIGAVIAPAALREIYVTEKDNHLIRFYHARTETLAGLREVGNEDEQVACYRLQDILSLPHFFPNHRPAVEAFLAHPTNPSS